MQDEDVIAKLSLLKNIEPRQEWANLAKERLIGNEKRRHFFSLDFIRVIRYYSAKPVLVMPILAFLVLGGIVIEQTGSSVPGDMLYSVKVSVEQTQHLDDLQLAQRRMEELKTVVETNKTKNLSVTIREFEKSVDKVSGSLAQLVENEPEKALQVSRDVIQLQRDKGEIEKILGTVIGAKPSGQFESAAMQLVEYELADLETRSLTQEQEEIFEQARGAFEQGEYQEALELIWILVHSQ
jgi:hypothetical protein